jgi:uncharacterized protein YndB with AHSA1/START domain
MIDKNYQATIEVAKLPDEVFRCITQEVSKWWGGKDYTGCSINLNDEFIINHPGAHYSKQQLIEVVPNKKVVWQVKESNLNWLQEKQEWTNTRMIFEIIPNGQTSILHFTHEGLVSQKESYARCSQGWDMVIKEWLNDLIVTGEAHFKEI